MGLSRSITLVLLALFLSVALLRILRTPLKLAIRLLGNTTLGFIALWATNLAAPVTGLALGLNLWNALIIAVLGIPGLILLLLAQWVL
jgi:inhibitor of the pro-sigma K processing machinery